MSNQQEFIIDQVSWHTRIPGNPESPESVRRRFAIIATFLQQNGLAIHNLLPEGKEPGDDFAIRSSDLTEEGLEVMKKGYEKWLKTVVNKRKDTADVSILERTLDRLRKR